MAGIKRDLKAAIDAANEEVAALSRGGFYAGGLGSEGFMGGYREALSDVMLALNGCEPRRWQQWREVAFAKRVAGKGGA